MRLVDVIENIWVDNLELENYHKSQVIKSYTDYDWISATKTFLKGLERQHQVPGKIIYQLQDIIYQFNASETITWEQKWLMYHSLTEHWNQMSCESRAELML